MLMGAIWLSSSLRRIYVCLKEEKEQMGAYDKLAALRISVPMEPSSSEDPEGQ